MLQLGFLLLLVLFQANTPLQKLDVTQQSHLLTLVDLDVALRDLLHIIAPIQVFNSGDCKDRYEEGLILFYFLQGASGSTQHPRAQPGAKVLL